MVNISLKEFFKTGQFGPVRLGMSRQEVFNGLGQPDEYSHFNYLKAGIWKYGDIEIHFSPDTSCVVLIWCDHIPFPGEPSAQVELDAWLFADHHQPTVDEMVTGLKDADIAYELYKFKEKVPGDMTMFLEEDEKSGQFVTITGQFVLDSSVNLGLGEVKTTFKDKRKPYIRKKVIVTIGLEDPNYFGQPTT